MKLDKILRLGVMQTSLYLDDKLTGWAGLAFMVGESKNFFMLELGSECKLTKSVNNDRKFLRKNPLCTLKPKQWYRIHVKIEEKSIIVLLGT